MMNYQRLIECGVSQWNQWRIQNPKQWPDLRGINLSHSYLFEINLMGSNLSGADLSRACLIGADLSGANLSGANLSGAYLNWANLREANLSNADLTEAQMTDADLLRANLAFTCLEPVKQAFLQPSCVSDSCVSDSCVSDSCVSDSCVSDSCVSDKGMPSLERVSQSHESQGSASDISVIEIALPKPVSFLKSPTFSGFSDRAVQLSRGGEASSALPMAWPPELLEQFQNKLSDYYIRPIVTLILNDIIKIYKPQTLGQFLERVAAHIPEPEEALRFRNSFAQNAFAQNSRQDSRKDLPSTRQRASAGIESLSDSKASTLTAACIAQCQQQLIQYYIAPMAQMLIDEVITAHNPKNIRQLVQLIAEQLPQDKAEIFVRQVLS